jgi:hypothetical protein
MMGFMALPGSWSQALQKPQAIGRKVEFAWDYAESGYAIKGPMSCAIREEKE